MSRNTRDRLSKAAALVTVRHIRWLGMLLASVLIAIGCATEGVSPYPTGDNTLAGRIKACRTDDTQVATAENCLQDDAACYQLADGNWCTGPRNTNCPTGSTELAADSPCPVGARCFQISEGKECAISFK